MARVDLPQTAGTRARLDRDPSTGRFLPRTLAASGCSPSTRFSIHPLLHQCISPPRSHPNAPRSTADTDTACSRMSSMPTLRRLGPIVTDLEHSTLSGHARVHAHPCPSQPRASPLLPRHRPKRVCSHVGRHISQTQPHPAICPPRWFAHAFQIHVGLDTDAGMCMYTMARRWRWQWR